MSDTLKEVGVIIGEASSNEFYFSSKPSEMPSRWEYVLTYSEEDIDGKPAKVEVVAQVERVISASQALTKELDFSVIEKIIEAGLADRKVWGKARVLGYLTGTGDCNNLRRQLCLGRQFMLLPLVYLRSFIPILRTRP